MSFLQGLFFREGVKVRSGWYSVCVWTPIFVTGNTMSGTGKRIMASGNKTSNLLTTGMRSDRKPMFRIMPFRSCRR